MNVNKTSTAVQWRFDVRNSPGLPDRAKANPERPAGRRLSKGAQTRRLDSKSKRGEVKRLRSERPD